MKQNLSQRKWQKQKQKKKTMTETHTANGRKVPKIEITWFK